MFCSPWDCLWRAPDQPFVFRLADGRPRKKSPLRPMHSSKSRSERKTPANMPSLRQLEFTFRSTDILSVGPPGVSPGELITEGSPQHVRPVADKMPAGHTAQTAALLQRARQLLCSLGA